MPFDSREYEWADLGLQLGNRDVTGFRGIKYTEKIEREALFAKGRHAHSIQSGNITVEGEITMLQSEVEALVKAGGGSLLKLKNLNAVVSYGNAADGNTPMTNTIEGIYFMESPKEMKQGDKFMEVTIPFVALRLKQ
jgi:hypothetical protein